MSVAQSFRITRAAVSAGALTAVLPPVTCTEVTILNLTTGDLQVHTNSDETEFLIIAASYRDTFDMKTKWFTAGDLAFWLKPSATGTVVLLWS